MPSTACIISDKLWIKNVKAFDISAACSGFVYALSIAKAFIESGMKKNV
jgi:3-oxoacyl-[acyl-carrier-protein] synthase-3